MKLVCSPLRSANTIKKLSAEHKVAVQEIDLGGLVHMKPIYLRRSMLVKVAKRYDMKTQNFSICGKQIPMTISDVNLIMGIPIQGYDANSRTQQPVKKTLFDLYQTNNRIMLSALEHNITTSVVPDDDFKRQFVLFTIGTILAPITKDHVDSKYLSLVHKVEDLPKINWGQFTLTNLLECIHLFQIKQQVNLQGNLALLQVCDHALITILHTTNYY
jgi:hypothetical protein